MKRLPVVTGSSSVCAYFNGGPQLSVIIPILDFHRNFFFTGSLKINSFLLWNYQLVSCRQYKRPKQTLTSFTAQVFSVTKWENTMTLFAPFQPNYLRRMTAEQFITFLLWSLGHLLQTSRMVKYWWLEASQLGLHLIKCHKRLKQKTASVILEIHSYLDYTIAINIDFIQQLPVPS